MPRRAEALGLPELNLSQIDAAGRFVLSYSGVNQPPNFGPCASAEAVQINDGESRQAYFLARVGDMDEPELADGVGF